MRHVIRYDGKDYPSTPDIIASTYQSIVNQVSGSADSTLFAQRFDEIGGGESTIMMFGLGVGLSFTTTTALAKQLAPDAD